MHPRPIAVITIALVTAQSGAQAAELVVSVSGGDLARGEVACALFKTPKGFPLDTSAAILQRSPAGPAGEACRFRDLKPGPYALAVSQMEKGQATVKLDLFGRPKQPWGVSNDVRPALRAPRFDEAVFPVNSDGDTHVTVKLGR